MVGWADAVTAEAKSTTAASVGARTASARTHTPDGRLLRDVRRIPVGTIVLTLAGTDALRDGQ